MQNKNMTMCVNKIKFVVTQKQLVASLVIQNEFTYNKYESKPKT
jgi:hypothetical protein